VAAIREAVDRALEAETAAAYRRQPDVGEEYFDPAEWSPPPALRRRAAR
jgi:hypothetical protein